MHHFRSIVSVGTTHVGSARTNATVRGLGKTACVV